MKINIISIAIILCFATSCTQNRAAEQYEKAMFYLDSLKNTIMQKSMMRLTCYKNPLKQVMQKLSMN